MGNEKHDDFYTLWLNGTRSQVNDSSLLYPTTYLPNELDRHVNPFLSLMGSPILTIQSAAIESDLKGPTRQHDAQWMFERGDPLFFHHSVITKVGGRPV